MQSSIFHRVLIPVDLSAASRGAFTIAQHIAPEARRLVLHVLPPIATVTGNVLASASRTMAAKEKAAEQLRQAVPADVDVDYRVGFGQAAEEIVTTANDWDADLIIMPARSHGPVEHALLGSVTERVLRTATCPVLVLPREHEKWSSL